MKFSVITPVYNSEEYLHTCIDSVVTQGYKDFELILVDDGSTDSSPEICRGYADKYENISVLCQENKGPATARNRGIDIAKGDYITFLDADDWVMPDYFEKLDEALTGSQNLLFFGNNHKNASGETAKVFPKADVLGNDNVIDFVSENFLCGDICSATNKVFSRKLLGETVRFPEGTMVEEDLRFVLNAVDKAENLKSIQDVLYCYNQREFGSITTKYNPHKFDCKVAAYKTELHIAEKWNKKKLAEIFHDNYLSYISACINNLMYKQCDLTRHEKISEIRRFYSADETRSCVSKSRGISLRSKVMYRLIKLKLYRVSYLIHYITFHIRRR